MNFPLFNRFSVEKLSSVLSGVITPGGTLAVESSY